MAKRILFISATRLGDAVLGTGVLAQALARARGSPLAPASAQVWVSSLAPVSAQPL